MTGGMFENFREAGYTVYALPEHLSDAAAQAPAAVLTPADETMMITVIMVMSVLLVCTIVATLATAIIMRARVREETTSREYQEARAQMWQEDLDVLRHDHLNLLLALGRVGTLRVDFMGVDKANWILAEQGVWSQHWLSADMQTGTYQNNHCWEREANPEGALLGLLKADPILRITFNDQMLVERNVEPN